MKKLLVFILLVIIGVGVAGFYGALHNQISYTVSPEFFTKFLFEKFRHNTQLPDRIRASFVGYDGSWGMGFLIGLLIGIVGFIHRGYRRMLTVSIQAMVVVVAFTFLFSLWGLVYGYYETANLNLADYHGWFPENIENQRRFLCANYMHNSSYLGGELSILVGWFYHIFVKIRTKS
jgi:MFS family permease